VTTDDFRQAMQDASGIDLGHFQLWYQQSGTPRVEIHRHYDSSQETLQLEINQDPGTTQGESNQPFHLPMRLSLFDQLGNIISLDTQGNTEQTIDIKKHSQKLKFEGIKHEPLVSAFRGFSAPIILSTDLRDDELATLMSCDTDPFNRWEAGQEYAKRIMLGMIKSKDEKSLSQHQGLLDAYRVILTDKIMDDSLIAEMMILPSEKYLGEMLGSVDVHKIRQVREGIGRSIAETNEDLLLTRYEECQEQGEYQIMPANMGKRSLKNICLAFLMKLDDKKYFDLCLEQFNNASNMTDQIGCLLPIVHYRNQARDEIVSRFYEQWQDTALVVDKWFSAQASSYAEGSLAHIKTLFDHAAYSLQNPNRARSLLGSLIANSSAFHDSSGAGYEFVAGKVIELDAINPQVAARMANAFLHWRKLVPSQAKLMKQQIEVIVSTPNLSNDLNELMTTSLAPDIT
jgi:aminopeptidase N